MIYLLDTNVVCESMARQPEPKVLKWCESHFEKSYLSCVTIGEIWKGISLLPEGKRKKVYASWVAEIEQDYAHVSLPLDTSVLKVWGKLCGKHQANGNNLGIIDSLIAATAITHGLILATRNTKDFPREVKTFNPWAEA
jgi:predicted nucleic acid-binding protein